MTIRILPAAAVFGLLAFPAFANCEQELSKLNEAVTASETGSTTEQVPVTKHQEEVMSGDQGTASTEPNGSSGQAVEAASPHQKEVMGNKDAADAQHPSEMMKEADDLAKAGDEVGCMEKVTQLKELIGAVD